MSFTCNGITDTTHSSVLHRLLAGNVTSGVSNETHASFSSWEAALDAYTSAYRANAVEILPRGPSRSQARRLNTPRATPGASRSNPYFVASNTPTPVPGGHADRATLVESSPAPAPRSAARLRIIEHAISELGSPITPTQSQSGSAQHPISIGSSPAPAPSDKGSTAPGTPVRQGSTAAEKRQTEAHLRAVQEALDELQSSLQTPPGPTPSRNALANTIRSRLQALEAFLREYEERNGLSRTSSPPTPTAENSSVEARLASLEEVMNAVLIREAERESLQSESRGVWQRSPDNSVLNNIQALGGQDHPHSASLDRSDARSQVDGPDDASLASQRSSTPIAGSSTGPGTIAGATTQAHALTHSNAPRSYSVVVIDDDSEDEYEFTPFSAEEEQELEELLDAIHENYNANKTD